QIADRQRSGRVQGIGGRAERVAGRVLPLGQRGTGQALIRPANRSIERIRKGSTDYSGKARNRRAGPAPRGSRLHESVLGLWQPAFTGGSRETAPSRIGPRL